MEDTQAMSCAVRGGDAAYSEDRAGRGSKIRHGLIEQKQAQGSGKIEIQMCSRWTGSQWEPGNVLPAGSKGSF